MLIYLKTFQVITSLREISTSQLTIDDDGIHQSPSGSLRLAAEPRLQVWMTQSTHERVLDHSQVVDELIKAVKARPEVPPIFSLDGYLLEKLREHSAEDPDDDLCLAKLTRPQIQKGLVCNERLFDSGCGPRCHGGALVTDPLLDPMKKLMVSLRDPSFGPDGKVDGLIVGPLLLGPMKKLMVSLWDPSFGPDENVDGLIVGPLFWAR